MSNVVNFTHYKALKNDEPWNAVTTPINPVTRRPVDLYATDAAINHICDALWELDEMIGFTEVNNAQESLAKALQILDGEINEE